MKIFSFYEQKVAPTPKPAVVQSCTPNPCQVANSQCELSPAGAAVCVCLPGYTGSELAGCRPECVSNAECPATQACLNRRCVDPCPGSCGQSVCSVTNHIPMCNCPPGYTGDPYDGRGCRIIPSVILPPLAIEGVLAPLPSSPCNPHPCGSNARCQVVFNTAQCSCLPGMIGTAPSCRPECVAASDCPSGRGCVNNKCVDPCPGTCATDAVCKVVDHSPFCSCQQGFTGNAFSLCRPIPAVGILRRFLK